MHQIKPFYNWQLYYLSEKDKRSPFFGRQYSEFEFSQTIYNYYIHPQWDDFGSRTLYLKVLMTDYIEKYAIIELLGEWNDAVENDIMELKREVLEKFMGEGIFQFVLIGENVLNFHSDGTDYYEELQEELMEEGGWVVALNFPESTQREFISSKIGKYFHFEQLDNWRTFKPFHLYQKVKDQISRQLGY